jgi:hypothetical protein
LVRGIVLVVAATVPLVFLKILITYGLDVTAVGICAGCLVLLATRRVPIVAVIAVGILAGIALYR